MDLFAKAAELGIETEFWDWQGRRREIDVGALANLVNAFPQQDAHRLVDGSVIVRLGATSVTPIRAGARPLRWQVVSAGTILAEGSATEPFLSWPADIPEGVHRLNLFEPSSPYCEDVPFIVTPAVAFQGNFSRSWILAIQLYGLRSSRNWGIGDFSDLLSLIDLVAGWGCDGIGLNPLHALFRERPRDCSPYSPNSRLFLNPLYIDVEDVAEYQDGLTQADREALANARRSGLVDYDVVAKLKWQALRSAYDRFRDAPAAPRRAAFDGFCAERGNALTRFACFEVLRWKYRTPWWEWPAPWQTPDGGACEDLRRGPDAADIEFIAYVQWIADQQLKACKTRAQQRGMSVGLYLDVAVGVQADGFDAWNEQTAISRHLAVGAPPDQLNTAGQNWGLAGFNAAGLLTRSFEPFRHMLQAAMRYAGAIRLDHILGFKRLYLVPHGYDAKDGAYVRMPFQALLAITALESRKHECVVIGEDLGTVPEGFREEIAEWGIWSYRVVMFERDHDGRFCSADRYAENALITFNTHDLATFAGWRSAGDLTLKRSLGFDPGETDDARRHAFNMLLDILRHHAIEHDDFFAVLSFLARTRSRLLAVALEDVLGVVDQPNLPGTVHEHPNWRRRIGSELGEIPQSIDLKAFLQALDGRLGGRHADPILGNSTP